MFLQLADRDQNIAVRVGVIEIVCGEEMAAPWHGETDVTLAIAEKIGVLEFHYGRRAGEERDVPAGADHMFLQGFGRFPRALQQTYTARSHPSHQVDGGRDHARMRPGGKADGKIPHTAFRSPGEIDFHRHCLALDDPPQPADLIEHPGQRGQQLSAVGCAAGERDWSGGRLGRTGLAPERVPRQDGPGGAGQQAAACCTVPHGSLPIHKLNSKAAK